MEKIPITKTESFLKSVFDLNQTCKIALTVNFGIFTLLGFLLFFLKIEEKLRSYKNVKTMKIGGDWDKIGATIYLFRQSCTKYMK